ncbi:MAG: citramalate synthase [Bacteroidetes bacterium QS_1_65_9]|nr:MAG: citramalate synthase [Bacteroidetes bacterium QS_1_65_9]
MTVPSEIELFDTTLRDGTQAAHVTLSARDKSRIARRLDAFGIDVIEGGWPGSNPKDQAFFEDAQGIDWQHAEVCAFGSTRHASGEPADDANLQALLDAGTPIVCIFGKSWTLHARTALGISLDENLELIRSSVAFLKDHGKRVIYDAEHFFDGHDADAEYACATLRAAADAGADTLVLCDTNGGSLPHTVHEGTATIHDELDATLGVHAHNDGGCATANTLAGVRAGARHVQGTVGGIGERCGNADLCAVIPNLQLKMGYECVSREQLSTLSDLSRFVSEVANLDPVENAPYVGRHAFAHKGGVHVSAVRKEPRAYEPVEPEVTGNRRNVLVSDLAGRSNVRYKADEMGIELGEDDEARRAVERIKELEHLGYEFQGAEASFELLVRTIQGEGTHFFERERLRVRSEQDEVDAPYEDSAPCVEATLVLNVQDHREIVAAEGEGPVDALSNALRKALGAFYPSLERVRLADYKVRVLTPQDGTAASVRVLVEHRTDDDAWNTVGVSTNILEASWQALADGIRYHLLQVESPSLEATADTKASALETAS